MQDNGKRGLFDKRRNVKAVIYGLFTACAMLFGLDWIIHRHVGHPWEAWFGFHAVYGFVVCFGLVLAAKEMRKLVRRGEKYYDE